MHSLRPAPGIVTNDLASRLISATSTIIDPRTAAAGAQMAMLNP
jgi:hypothetical protein